MESEDFDYEISNKVVNEYLNSLGFNENFDGYNQIDENITEKEETLPQSNTNCDNNGSFSPITFFFKKDFIINFLNINEACLTSAVFKSDIDVIIEENLIFINNFPKFNLKAFFHKHKFFLLNTLILFLSIFVISYYTSFLIISFLSILIFIIVLKFSSYILNIYFFKWLQLTNNYISLNRKIISYIKTYDLIDLNIKRRHLIESKNSKLDAPDLNFTYRKTLFLALRSHFFSLKELNLKFINTFKIDDTNLICSINKNDLSIVMQLNGECLDKSTDNYSAQCISSLAKLNNLIISENFKLIILSFFIILKRASNLINFILLIFDSLKKIKQLRNNLNELENILKLIDKDQTESNKKTKQLSLDENLSFYLRNALLNSYEIRQTQQVLKAEKLKMLKINIEYCNLYYEQLEASLGFENSIKKDIKINEKKLETELNNNEKNDHEIITENDDVVVEDEIFEAENDLNDFEDIKLDNYDVEELSLKQKQEMFNTKNLFYELKFALKPKTNEWNQREKNIKKKQVVSKDDADEKINHLLENDVMLYKSSIKKKRRNKQEKIDLDLVEEPKRKYKYEIADSENEHVGPGVNLLKELMSKRNFMFNKKNSDEEILSD